MSAHLRLPPLVSGRLPLAGHAIEFLKNPEAVLRRGLREHGLAFSLRFGPNPVVVLLGSEHHRTVFAHPGFSVSAANQYFVRMFGRGFYYYAGESEYRRQRDLVLPLFRRPAFDGHEAVMLAESEALSTRLGARGTVDLVPALGRVVTDIAGKCFLGVGFEGGSDEQLHEDLRLFSGGMDPVLPDWVPAPHLVRSRRAGARLRARFAAGLAGRRAEPVTPPDFLQEFAGGADDDVLVNLMLLLAWAGQETTTGQLAWTLIDLLRNPVELRAVTDEVRSTPGHAGLSALDAAIRESERLHPVAFLLARHTTEPVEFGDFTVPADVEVVLSPALSHRLPGEYADPDVYRPSRFLDDRSAAHRLAGFGQGVHRCLGVHFAQLEMKVVLAHLLRTFDFAPLTVEPEPVPGTKTKWPRGCVVGYRRR